MSEKRRLSTRNRGEPPLKKRALTPTPPPAAPTAPRPLPEPFEEGLPVRLREGRPLPALPEPQDIDFSTKAYQTISESGVLAASIERSRQRWLSDGLFERYWAKPSKKRDMGNTPNPAKETMTKLGHCSMIIDPHVFEVTLYTVKDLPISYAPVPVQPPSLSAPQYNPFSPNATYAPSIYNTPPAATHPPYRAQQHTQSSQPFLPPFREGFGSFGPQGPPPIYRAPVHTTAPATAPEPTSLSRLGSTNHGASQSGSGEPKPDPVIQMLATRAASDPGLKALMKVVASGKASQTQLREFQDHIDELNSILKSGQSPTVPPESDNKPGRPQHGRQEYAPRPPYPSTNSDVPWNQTDSGFTYPSLQQASTPIKAESSSQSYSLNAPPVNTKPHNNTKSDIDGIVFDFGGGTGDRFSFPRFSILEYLYGGTQVIVSFLVIRRGNTIASAKYKGTMSYYQPITMRLTTPHPKVLEPLARAVAPPDEVRRYMDDYFDKLSPAETVFLATRLPRTVDAEDIEKQDPTNLPENHLIKPVYSPPHSVMPLTA